MLEIMPNGLQGFGHVCFYSEPGNIHLFGNRLMAQAFYLSKAEYLFLLWRELVYSLMKKFLVLFFYQGMIRAIYRLNTMGKSSFRYYFFRNILQAIEDLVTRHCKEIAFKVEYPGQFRAPHPYFQEDLLHNFFGQFPRFEESQCNAKNPRAVMIK